jgi:hypothetical protein
MAGGEVLGSGAVARGAGDGAEISVIVAKQFFRERDITLGRRAEGGVRGAFLLDADKEDGARGVAANGFDAGRRHAGDLLDGVLERALGGRQEFTGLQVCGGDDALGCDLVQTVEVDVADARRLGRGERGRKPQKWKKAAQIPPPPMACF